MTLITRFKLNGHPMMIGDILISVPSWKAATAQFPSVPLAVRAEAEFCLSANQSSPHQIAQKLVIVGNNLLFGWCGHPGMASEIVAHVRKRWPDCECTVEGMRECLSSVPPEYWEKVGLTGYLCDGKQSGEFSIGVGLREGHSEVLRELVTGGTGQRQFEEMVESFEVGLGKAGGAEAVASGLNLIGSMLHDEHLGVGTLGECFGGGYELAYYNGGFKKNSDVLFLFWHMVENDGELRQILRHGVRYSYVGDVLLMRMMDLSSSYPAVLMQEFEVFPIDADPTAAGNYVHPPLSCPVVQNSIRVQLKDGSVINGGGLLITSADERIRFSEDGNSVTVWPSDEVSQELRRVATKAIEMHKAAQ